jgi:hypothetical protein
MNIEMKQKTAMAQHIEWLEKFVKDHDVKDLDYYPGHMAISVIEYVIEDAKNKLALEKEQIEDAYENIENHNGFDSYPTGEAYYNDKFEIEK